MTGTNPSFKWVSNKRDATSLKRSGACMPGIVFSRLESTVPDAFQDSRAGCEAAVAAPTA
jgi:hypothetical protein